MVGFWKLESGETEGWEYSASKEEIESSINIYKKGEKLYADYRYITDYENKELEGVEGKLIEGDDVKLITDEVEWCVKFALDDNAETTFYLSKKDVLAKETYFVIDGSPNATLQLYAKEF